MELTGRSAMVWVPSEVCLSVFMRHFEFYIEGLSRVSFFALKR